MDVDVNGALNMVSNKASRVNVVVHVGKTSSAGILLAVKLGWHQKFENVNSVLEKCEDDVDYHSCPGCEVVPEEELRWNVSLKLILEIENLRFPKRTNMLNIYFFIILPKEYSYIEALILIKLCGF